MITQIEIQMMSKFLQRDFPITKIKSDMRFKRGVNCNGNTYLLSDEIQLRELKFQLITLIMTIFDCNDAISKSVVINHLQNK